MELFYGVTFIVVPDTGESKESTGSQSSLACGTIKCCLDPDIGEQMQSTFVAEFGSDSFCFYIRSDVS